MNLLIERRALNYQTPHPVKESNPARQVLEARPYPVPKADGHYSSCAFALDTVAAVLIVLSFQEPRWGSESLVLSVPTPTELRKQDQSLAHLVAYPQVSI